MTRAAVFVLLCIPLSLAAQSPRAPLGTARGVRIGNAARDTGMVDALPRAAVAGSATHAVETDTFDFRRKWTVRLRFPSPDTMEMTLRYGDSIPPRPGRYALQLLATGVSQERGSVAGTLRVWEGTRWQPYVVGSFDDSVSFAAGPRGSAVGTVAAVGGRIDQSDPATRPVGVWRYRGLSVDFNARREPSRPAPAPDAVAEDRIMRRAIDGLMITWSGASNGDGTIEPRTAAGVRAYLDARWSATLAVDSVAVQGEALWIRLRGLHAGRRCWQGGRDSRIACDWAPGRRPPPP